MRTRLRALDLSQRSSRARKRMVNLRMIRVTQEVFRGDHSTGDWGSRT